MTLALIAVAIGLAGTAVAQQPDGPQATTATYRDWTLRCETIAGPSATRICEIVQAVRSADRQAVLAQVVIGYPGPEQPPKLIVQLPAGVWLPAGVQLVPPNGDSATAAYTRCQQLCVADVDLEPGIISALKAGNEPALLIFQDGARRTIELPISLNGFTAALGAAEQPSS